MQYKRIHRVLDGEKLSGTVQICAEDSEKNADVLRKESGADTAAK
jgi:hypothetical protein